MKPETMHVHPVCPFCEVSVRADRLDSHLVNTHLLGRPELLKDALKALLTIREDLLTCGFCHQQIKKKRLASHFLRVHKSSFPDSAAINKQQPEVANIWDALVAQVTMDPKIFLQLLNERCLVATKVERCECRKFVGFVETKLGTLKSFDVDSKLKLIGPHICDGEKSKSIYAFSGGGIDSNRRRH